MLAQAAAPADSAQTLFKPNLPDPGRIGQTETPPSGGVGVTLGGTQKYQTLGAPGGGGVAVPNGNNTSSLIAPNGRSGVTGAPR